MKKKIFFQVIIIFILCMNNHAYAQTKLDSVIAQRIRINLPTLEPGFQYTLDSQKVLETQQRMQILMSLSNDPKFKNICIQILGCGINLIQELTPSPIMVPVPVILMTDVDPSRFSTIEKLLSPQPIMKLTDPVAVTPGFDLTVAKTDVLKFIDYAQEDGDIISIYFNGIIAHSMISIEHEPFIVPVDSKIETIEIVAEDEGLMKPCTLEVLINEKFSYFQLHKGEKIKIIRK